VTKVMVDEHNTAISSSWDQTLIIWDLTSKKEVMKLKGAHKSIVREFDWHNSLLVSGDKDGYVAFWDINEGRPFKVAKAHTVS
jgi:WD40 repeat protein